MNDARELLKAYATAKADGDSSPYVRPERADAAPKAFDALRVVLDRHQRFESAAGPVCTADNFNWPCPEVRDVAKALEES